MSLNVFVSKIGKNQNIIIDTDMTMLLGEAYEAVDDGSIDAAAFRAFTDDNAVRFYAHGNPKFFAGTSVAEERG